VERRDDDGHLIHRRRQQLPLTENIVAELAANELASTPQRG
jgi:hypothetical protein